MRKQRMRKEARGDGEAGKQAETRVRSEKDPEKREGDLELLEVEPATLVFVELLPEE